MKIIFQIDGGIGKSIAATAVCKAIKNQYPNDELIVVTAYPDVFLGNPNVDMKFGFNDRAYFYQTYIEGKDVKMCLHNPYLETDFITGNGHLIKIWCEMFGIKYSGEQPELFINSRERDYYGKMFGSDKPIFLLQTNGGAPDQHNKYSWARDLPQVTAQRIVNEFARDYNVVHIRREDQPALQNTVAVQQEFRALATLIMLSEKRLFIDSFAQHAAAALNKPSVVCWITNMPTQFGYELHTNIMAHPPTGVQELRHSVYSKYNISGAPVEFPYYNEDEIFDTHKIINALKGHDISHPESTKFTKENKEIRERTLASYNRGGMVANRLVWLLGNEKLDNITRILDIGSWHLRQSIELSGIFPNAKIDAFEPVPSSYQLCLENHSQLDQQRKERISIHNIALSDKAGEIPFYAVPQDSQQGIDAGFSSMFKFMDSSQGLKDPNGGTLQQQEIMVRSETLDNWCAANATDAVDIIWMDVQGAELLVLHGAEKILKNTRIILTEVGLKPYYEGHTLKDDIDKYLSDLGFRELKEAFEYNIAGYEANVIYVRD